MAKNLLVSMQIPISLDEKSSRSIAFKHWLPMREEDIVVTNYDNLTIKIWFNLSCLDSLTEENEETISKRINVRANKINVDVIIEGVANDLVNFIYNELDWERRKPEETKDDPEYQRLFDEYHSLGRRVLRASIHTVNRVLSYFRNQKLQYWIEEQIFDERNVSSYALQFNSRVKAEEHDWIEWYPATRVVYGSIHSEDHESLLEKDEWPKVRDYVNSGSRPPLPKELLANSFALIRNNNERSALIEAVSALEVSISEFAKNPNYPLFLDDTVIKRMAQKSLAEQVKHLGVRGTIRFLFPIMFKPEAMPEEILTGCQEAVDLRNNLIHNGQRRANPDKVWQMLRSITKICMLLEGFTSK